MKKFLLALLLLASPVHAQNTFFAGSPGDMIYRGTLGWAAVPGGVAGQLLMSNGPTAAPFWTVDLSQVHTLLLPTQSTNTVLGNVTGSTASPVPITQTQFLDTLGYDIVRPPTVGSIPMKASFGINQSWQALQPGPAGFVLVSNGLGNDLTWTSVAGTATPGIAGTCLESNGVAVAPTYQACLNATNFAASSPLVVSFGTPQTTVSCPTCATTTGTLAGAVGTVLAGTGGASAFTASPTLSNSLTAPLIIGGTATNSILSLKTTSNTGVSPTSVMNIVSGIDGATNIATFGATSPTDVSMQIGTPGAARGSLYLSGGTSGAVKITPQAAAGTWSFNLPTTAGTVGQVLTSQGGGNTAMIWAAPAVGGGAVTPPQGRITLTSGTALTTADVVSATTHYYTPSIAGSYTPITTDGGATFAMVAFTEMSQATTDSTKSPAAVAANKIYDIFIWSDSGTLRATRGPVWSSDTSRGTGAGTSEIDFSKVFPVNKVAITNGPTAGNGVLVGSVRSNGSSQLMDSVLFRWVSNIYQATPRPMIVTDTAASWTYSTATFRQANANSANQLDWLSSLPGGIVTMTLNAAFSNTSVNTYGVVGIDIDTINTTQVVNNVTYLATVGVASQFMPAAAQYAGFPGLGRHIGIWKELAGNGGTGTFYGNAGTLQFQTGMTGSIAN